MSIGLTIMKQTTVLPPNFCRSARRHCQGLDATTKKMFIHLFITKPYIRSTQKYKTQAYEKYKKV